MAARLDLKVASYNIRNGLAWDGLDSWPFRRRATARAVARLDADVIGMQEVYGFQQCYLRRRLGSYSTAGVGGTDGRRRGGRCAVFYRAPLLLERQRTRWFCDTPDVPGSKAWESRVPRIVTFAWFTEPHSGRRFGFANLHLEGGSQRSRTLSARALLDWIDRDRPWIVVGDFNAAPDDPAVGMLLEGGFRDTCVVALEQEAARVLSLNLDLNVSLDPGPTGARGGRRVDYVFATPEWEVVAARVERDVPPGRRPSDHLAVTARLRLG